jgi:hypothetical protein
MPTISTWAGRSRFSYDGCPSCGTRIVHGKERVITIDRNDYRALRAVFIGKTVAVGASRTHPPKGSLGHWLAQHVRRTAVASYVAAILIEEGYAQRVGSGTLRVTR